MIHRRHPERDADEVQDSHHSHHQTFKIHRRRPTDTCIKGPKRKRFVLLLPILTLLILIPYPSHRPRPTSSTSDPFPRTVRIKQSAKVKFTKPKRRRMPGGGSAGGRIDDKSEHHRRKLDKDAIMQTRKQRKELADSDDYDHRKRDSLWSEECEPMQSWQETLFPSCNVMHEMGLGHVREEQDLFSKLSGGGYNEVFVFNLPLPPEGEHIVLKVLKYGTEYTDRNYDRVRRDALISERLTRSNYIVDILGHCGLSELAPLSVGGTMSHLIDNSDDESMEDSTKLKLATVAAIGLADLHNIDRDGVPSVTHGDLKNNQYLLVNGEYRLGDFNRGRFLRKNRKTGEPCPYTIGKNDAKYRSPEEYRYDPLTAKIDVWALGSTIFRILTGETVWRGHRDVKATQKKIAKTNATPPLPQEYQDSSDPIHKLLRKVMYEMCFVGDPEKRASAAEVAAYLTEKAKELGIDNYQI